MKFKSTSDIQLFLIDVGCYDGSDVDEDFTPSQEQLETFFHTRNRLFQPMVNFRKSQQQKQNWKHNRMKLMKGIKIFHKSTQGKRFHRNLGRHIATHNFEKGFLSSASEDHSQNKKAEMLKAVSSLKTHAFIEMEYYHPLLEEVDYLVFMESLFEIIGSIEKKFYMEEELDQEEQEFLLRLIDPEVLDPLVGDNKISEENGESDDPFFISNCLNPVNGKC